MITRIKAPDVYINEPGITAKAGEYIRDYGTRALLIGSPRSYEAVGDAFDHSLDSNKITYQKILFTGYPTFACIEEYTAQAKVFQADVIVPIGGGKIHDIAKAVADKHGVPVVSVPTIAATCASWAAVSILYHADGATDDAYFPQRSPALILADTHIIATAPKQYLCAGILDTYAKFCEALPQFRREPEIMLNQVSIDIAKRALEILDTYGLQAVIEGEQGIVGEAAKQTIDAVIYMAGLTGSVQGGRPFYECAHPFYEGSTLIPSTRFRLHGEKVAFGLIVQAVLDRNSEAEITELLERFHLFDLALTLEDIGLAADGQNDLAIIADFIVRSTEFTLFDGKSTRDDVIKAIRTADEFTRTWKKRARNEE